MRCLLRLLPLPARPAAPHGYTHPEIDELGRHTQFSRFLNVIQQFDVGALRYVFYRIFE